MEKITKEDSELILQEMFNRVSAGSIKDFDFERYEWFRDYEWTEVEQEDFNRWLANFLVEHKYFRKNEKYRNRNRADYEASKIISNYGWKLKSN